MGQETPKDHTENTTSELPLLPLRDVVVFPQMVVPLFVGREKSILALEESMAGQKQIVLVAQRNASDDDPGKDEIYGVGTLANVLQMLKLPDGTVKVLVEGSDRVVIDEIDTDPGYMEARFHVLEEESLPEAEVDPLSRTLMAQFEQYVNLSKKIPSEVVTTLSGIDEIHRQVDTIATHMTIPLEQKQEVLEAPGIQARADMLLGFMDAEIEVFQID
jgi:ATP-dependent Lon protease, bacterial type